MFNIPLDLFINTGQTQTTQTVASTTPGIPATRKYYPVPPTYPSVYQYQNVNKDMNLRLDVTKFFHRKVIKWLDSEESFHKYQSKKSYLESTDGQLHIYRLLRMFVKRSGINWYDLRDNYSIIKDFLSKKLF
jgi:hypothetical protein